MLYDLSSLLTKAQDEPFAIGAFNVNSYIFADAFIKAAEKANSALILQVSPGILRSFQGTSFIPSITYMANFSSVPIVIHLDHAKSIDDLKYALQYPFSFSSYMVDGSHLPLEENIALINSSEELIKANLLKKYPSKKFYEDYTVYSTKQDKHKPEDVCIEAEIGHVGNDSTDASTNSKVVDVEKILSKTNAKAIAVSIGNAHGQKKQDTDLDINLLKSIRDVTNVPLVLHGSSGVRPTMIQEAIKNGITKVNINTRFKEAVKNVYESGYSQSGSEIFSDFKKLQPLIFKTLFNEALDCLKLLNSENSAEYFKQ